VVSITPELKEDRQIAIKMRVAGDTGERMNELLRKMEQSRRFRETQMTGYSAPQQSAGGDNVLVEISALYVPNLRGE
jgi:hypothetical protein